MTFRGARTGVAVVLLGLAAGCAPPPAPSVHHAAAPAAAGFPVTWSLDGFEGPLVAVAPPGKQWTRRGTWEAFDGRTGMVFLGPPMKTPPPLPDLLAALDPQAVPAALPGGGYRVFDDGDGQLWYRRFELTGQDCVGFVRVGKDAADLGAWGYYCAAPGATLPRKALISSLAALRWSVVRP